MKPAGQTGGEKRPPIDEAGVELNQVRARGQHGPGTFHIIDSPAADDGDGIADMSSSDFHPA